MSKFNKAFTLIEVLVVCAILAILATVVVVNVNGSSARSRDLQRSADIAKVAGALELYYNNNKNYPAPVNSAIWYTGSSVISGSEWSFNANWASSLVPNYIESLPAEPKPDNSIKRAYGYRSDGANYKMLANQPENCESVANRSTIDPARDGGLDVTKFDGSNCQAWAFYSQGAIGW